MTTPAAFPKTDVFVIGGGPVGLAAAIAARRKGFRVLLADALEPPIDKACGEGVLPDGIAAAAALGIHLPAVHSHTIRGIRFHGGGVSVAADFPKEPGRGIRRTNLHRALVDEATSSGVEVLWGCSVQKLEQIDARWVIGADGMRSRVRGWARLNTVTRDKRRYGFRRHFRIAPWNDYVDIHWGNGCQIYVTPVAQDEISVALLTRDPKQRVADALTQFPALAERIAGAVDTSSERGALTASCRLRRVTRGNVALIGDSSGSADAVSGEGLSLGFRQALALAEAIEKNDLLLYESAHRRLSRRPRSMADFMLTMDHWPWLRRRALRSLAAHPGLFAGLLAMHVGEARTTKFAADCVALGWRMLTA